MIRRKRDILFYGRFSDAHSIFFYRRLEPIFGEFLRGSAVGVQLKIEFDAERPTN